MAGDTIAFIPPRYGPEIVGGAEIHARMLAEEIQSRGWPVEILTTCAKDPYTWTGDYQPGTEVVGGITVRRFQQEPRKYAHRATRIERRIAARKKISVRQGEFWIRDILYCPPLYRYLDENRNRYRAFVFIPYLFGTTYFGVKTVPEKAYLIPCIHDEPFAYVSAFRKMMHSARGIMFNTQPEMELARRIYGEGMRGRVVGGVAFKPYSADGERFRFKYSIEGDFVLYSGRSDVAKNTPLLTRYFCNYIHNTGRDVKLVFIGSERKEIPYTFRKQVIDLGFVSERDKRDAYAAATVLCQPSTRESLSLVLLEAWLAEVPVLVHGDCAVTRDHVEKSSGGLWFTDYATFHEALDFMLDHPEVRLEMGRRGKEYVERNYNWDVILERFFAVLEEGEGATR